MVLEAGGWRAGCHSGQELVMTLLWVADCQLIVSHMAEQE